jgi:hypothetical protein
MRCACGGSFDPDETSYHDHVRTIPHLKWSNGQERPTFRVYVARSEPEPVPVDPVGAHPLGMFACWCGGVHWGDSSIGRRHSPLGARE